MKGAEWALEDIPHITYVCSLFSLIQTFKASANPKHKHHAPVFDILNQS